MILDLTTEEVSTLVDILDIFAGEHDNDEFARNLADSLWNALEEDRRFANE